MRYNLEDRTFHAFGLFAILVFAMGIFSPSTIADDLVTSPTPAWVKQVSATDVITQLEADRTDDNDPIKSYNRQYNYLGENPVTFTRYIAKIDSQQVLNQSSNFHVQYSSEHQSYELHAVTVIRDGEVLNFIDNVRATFTEITNDEGYGDQTGRSSVQLFIPRLKTGDIIEVSHSVVGQNSAFGNKAFGAINSIEAGWQNEHFTVSIFMPEQRPLTFEKSDSVTINETTDDNGIREYSWTFEQEDADDISRAYVHFSEFSEWSEMVRWGMPLLSETASVSDVIINKAQSLTNGKKKLEAAKALIAFVKREIDYVGPQLERHGYKPYAPELVLERSYGDCKDQSTLLISLMRAVGIEAAPALVTTFPFNRPYKLPSPLVFDHVIVKYQVEGKSYWVDPSPSISPNSEVWLSFNDYNRGLVLTSGSNGIEEIPAGSNEKPSIVTHEISLRSDSMGFDKLKTTSELRGVLADQFRIELANGTLEDLNDKSEKSIKNRFDQEIIEFSLKMKELNDEEAIQVNTKAQLEEKYRFEDDNDAIRETFYAMGANMINLYSNPFSGDRPTSLPYPLNVKESFIFDAKGDFYLEPALHEVKNDYFRFKQHRYFKGKKFHVDFELETLQRTIDSDAIEDLKDDIKTFNKHRVFALWEHKQLDKIDTSAGVRSIYSNLYKRSPQRKEINAKIQEHMQEARLFGQPPVEALIALLSWDNIPLDSRVAINTFIATMHEGSGDYEKALENIKFVEKHTTKRDHNYYILKADLLASLGRFGEAHSSFINSFAVYDASSDLQKKQHLKLAASILPRVFRSSPVEGEIWTALEEFNDAHGDKDERYKDAYEKLYLRELWRTAAFDKILPLLKKRVRKSSDRLEWSQIVWLHELLGDEDAAKAERKKMKKAKVKFWVPREVKDKSITKYKDKKNADLKPAHRTPPIYPRKAFKDKTEGWVLVEYDVTKDGAVEKCKVVDSEPRYIFDKTACSSIMEYRYIPLKDDTREYIAKEAQIVVRFKLGPPPTK